MQSNSDNGILYLLSCIQKVCIKVICLPRKASLGDSSCCFMSVASLRNVLNSTSVL